MQLRCQDGLYALLSIHLRNPYAIFTILIAIHTQLRWRALGAPRGGRSSPPTQLRKLQRRKSKNKVSHRCGNGDGNKAVVSYSLHGALSTRYEYDSTCAGRGGEGGAHWQCTLASPRLGQTQRARIMCVARRPLTSLAGTPSTASSLSSYLVQSVGLELGLRLGLRLGVGVGGGVGRAGAGAGAGARAEVEERGYELVSN